MLTYLSHLTVL